MRLFYPIFYVIGWLIIAFGLSMVLPCLTDLYFNHPNWQVFLASAVLTCFIGAVMVLIVFQSDQRLITLRQNFILTLGVWVTLPFFGALPFVLGGYSNFTDGFFEAMSGLTTTGSTIFTQIPSLPPGVLLWRGLLQWFGGIGIIIVALVFLPELRIGGMQIFRTEGLNTLDQILPRAKAITIRISIIYIVLTGFCAIVYGVLGMSAFDAVVHAMTTIATGGFANYDASFAVFTPRIQYATIVFMLLASLPFIHYVHLFAGTPRFLISDSQVHTFFAVFAVLVMLVVLWRVIVGEAQTIDFFDTLRSTAFNVASILTGTGYTSTDYTLWGNGAVVWFFFIGLIGGCAGSTSCSIKIFRYQLLFVFLRTHLKRLRYPNGVFVANYKGRAVPFDVLSSVMVFFVLFFLSLGTFSILLNITGLDFITAVSGAATALANIGPGLGNHIGPSGHFAALNAPAKWILLLAMLVGRLELMAVFVLLTPRFWQS